MQAFGDIGNRSERYEVTCTLEHPSLFAGEQETLIRYGLRKVRLVGAFVGANPEFQRKMSRLGALTRSSRHWSWPNTRWGRS
jgi:hypothetical protein